MPSPDAEVLPLADAALRGGLVALLLLTATCLVRERFDAPAARVGAWLLAGLSVQMVASLPLMERSGPWWWQAPLVGLSVGNAVLFWLFARSLFDDAFMLKPAHLIAWLAVVALGLLFFAVVVMPQQHTLTAFPLAVAVAMRWTPIVFAALAVAAAASQWRADLVERRRRLRGFILVTGTAYTVLTALARLASDDGRMAAWMSGLDVAWMLLMVGTVAVRLLRVGDSELLPVPQRLGAPSVAPEATAALDTPPAAGAAPDPAEDRLAAELHRVMTLERAYRQEDLTVASLARLLGSPEYRLRRLINQRLGHRNFNAYVNAFRIEEAQRWLADPGQREAPILTLALDAGFGSVGPFNRAFKAATGMTPSEFRRLKLADS
jgi:AraC-like DNA-binding protein